MHPYDILPLLTWMLRFITCIHVSSKSATLQCVRSFSVTLTCIGKQFKYLYTWSLFTFASFPRYWKANKTNDSKHTLIMLVKKIAEIIVNICIRVIFYLCWPESWQSWWTILYQQKTYFYWQEKANSREQSVVTHTHPLPLVQNSCHVYKKKLLLL